MEVLPNWPTHFRGLKKKLGYAPNGCAFGMGVCFMPKSDEEYCIIQKHLMKLKETGISCFSYSLPAERNQKVAIRGLPSESFAPMAGNLLRIDYWNADELFLNKTSLLQLLISRRQVDVALITHRQANDIKVLCVP